ncbi:MAG: hypothetical protein Ta2B_18770 [Termitinemataceae bacterium]|nr:MAG: hypothetical protein Ta2B_18770 [Termitinemataceae bacterium]
MTKLRQILAVNMKENRCRLGISQAKLAEKADISTNFVAMIELEKKFPSPEMLERIAAALEIDTPQLFSIPTPVAESPKRLNKTVLNSIRNNVNIAVEQAVTEAVNKVIDEHLKLF